MHSSNIKIGLIIPSGFESDALGFAFDVHMVTVSGMGKLMACRAVYELVQGGCNFIMMTGFCGGLKDCQRGQILQPIAVAEGDYDARPLKTKYPLILKIIPRYVEMMPAIFISQDRFLKENPYKEVIEAWNLKDPLNKAVVTDMESYAVAETCVWLHQDFFIMKMVSDIVGEESPKDFFDSCNTLAPTLADKTREVIETLKKEKINAKS